MTNSPANSPANRAANGPAERALEPDLEGLQAAIDYRFADARLLRTALVHRSAPNERRDLYPESNERMEFLGDAVLDLVIARILFDRYPASPEGELTRYKATLVSEAALASIAGDMGLGRHLLLGRGEEDTQGREKPSILADALEAVLGALFLDGGLAAAERAILHLFRREIGTVAARSAPRGDFKTALQEWTQAAGMGLPAYRLLGADGPDHARSYTVAVLLKGTELAQGNARSKREAERIAARRALTRLTGAPADDTPV